jgi:GDP-mannose pyrophosphatase NudK
MPECALTRGAAALIAAPTPTGAEFPIHLRFRRNLDNRLPIASNAVSVLERTWRVDDRIRILGEQTLSSNWGVLKKVRFEIEERDGVRRTHEREVYDRGNAAVVLLLNRDANSVILTRQFRLPAYLNGDGGWLLEVCAGRLEGDDPETCARREAEEETGYRPGTLTHVFDSAMSPGSVTERLSFFFGEYDAGSRVSDGGGLAHEGEDIEVIEMKFEVAYGMIATSEIIDAKTIMLLQHAALTGTLRR